MRHPKIVREKTKEAISGKEKTMRGHGGENIQSKSEGKATTDSIVNLEEKKIRISSVKIRI